jgi:hypothetical protein
MGIEIGSKKMGGASKLGAFAEELGTGLEVGDTAVEVKGGIALEGGNFGSKERGDEISCQWVGQAR